MTGGNCWGDEANRPVDPDPEPDFEDLDKVLEAICPEITFLQYKNLVKHCVTLVNETENGYYGNYYYRSAKRVNLDDLATYLKEKGLW